MARPSRYPQELLDRGVRLALEGERPISHIAQDLGIGPETLRNAASDPEFLASVLDFVMRDDATVQAFAKVSELHPTNIAAAHQVLRDPNWERDVP